MRRFSDFFPEKARDPMERSDGFTLMRHKERLREDTRTGRRMNNPGRLTLFALDGRVQLV
jgi:hypothetical protein